MAGSHHVSRLSRFNDGYLHGQARRISVNPASPEPSGCCIDEREVKKSSCISV